jgi:serine/threonine-protein kinase Chk1
MGILNLIRISFSQPDDLRNIAVSPDAAHFQFETMSFSQPASNLLSESPVMVVCRESLAEISNPLDIKGFSSSQITRFYSLCDPQTIFLVITSLLDDMLVQYKIHSSLLKISFSTVDRRKCPLHGDILIQSLKSSIFLVSFHKNKGDSLEFKRFFKTILENSSEIVSK